MMARKVFLEKSLKKLEKRVCEEQAEYEKLKIALGVLERYGLSLESVSVQEKPKTVGDMALAILREHPRGLPAADILRNIQELWMPNLMRSSLSPPLSRLKERGEIILEGEIWRLLKGEASDAEGSEASLDFEQEDDYMDISDLV